MRILANTVSVPLSAVGTVISRDLSTAACTVIAVGWTTGECGVGIPAGVDISPRAGPFRLSQSSSLVLNGRRFLSSGEKGGRDMTLITSLLTKPKFRKVVIWIVTLIIKKEPCKMECVFFVH